MQVKFRIGDSTSEWEEELTVLSLEVAETAVLVILEEYNIEEERRYGEKARKRRLLGIVGQTSDVHNWVKQTVVYNNKVEYICSRCHLIKKISYASLSRPGTQEKCYPERVCRICNKQFVSTKNYNKHYMKKHSD